MKGTVTIPKWLYYVLLAGAILNIVNFVGLQVNGYPEVNIHILDEKKGSDPS